jgi:hypothetical protein
VSRDFLLQVFFLDHLPPSPWKHHYSHFEFFRKFTGRKSRCTTGINDTGGKFATGINDTGDKILPPVQLVLLIPVENLPPVSTTLVANCHRYQQHRQQTISGCRHLKVNLKAKISIYVNSTIQRWHSPFKQTKIMSLPWHCLKTVQLQTCKQSNDSELVPLQLKTIYCIFSPLMSTP